MLDWNSEKSYKIRGSKSHSLSVRRDCDGGGIGHPARGNKSRSLYTMIKFPPPFTNFPSDQPLLPRLSLSLLSSQPTLFHSLIAFFSCPSLILNITFFFSLPPPPPPLPPLCSAFISIYLPWYPIRPVFSAFSFYSLGCLLLYTFLSPLPLSHPPLRRGNHQHGAYFTMLHMKADGDEGNTVRRLFCVSLSEVQSSTRPRCVQCTVSLWLIIFCLFPLSHFL